MSAQASKVQAVPSKSKSNEVESGEPGSGKVKAAKATRGGTWIVAGRELQQAFDSPIAYVTAIGFVLLVNSSFMNEFFLAGRVELSPYFELLPLFFIFFVPAITMRLWAEERKTRTFEVLMTLPFTPLQVVLGKFAAGLCMLLLWLLGSLPLLFMLFQLGEPDIGRIAAGYLGAVLLGSLFLSAGMLLSSLSSDQIVAFVLATVVGALLVLSGNDRVVTIIDGLFPERGLGTWLSEHISVLPPYRDFVRGALRVSSSLFFAGLSGLLLWATSAVVEKRR